MFDTEVQLGAPVVAWLKAQGGSCVAHEVEVGAGIPDLVAGMGDRTALRNRRRQAAPITDPVQLSLLEYCRTARTDGELRSWAPNGFATLVRRVLTPLLELNLLSHTAQGYRTRTNPRDPFITITAVELKLVASERGFAQTYSYRLFADRSYFAVPARRVSVAAMTRARELGVGLLAVHPGRVDEIVEASRTSLVTAGRRRMASERVLAASRRTDGRVAGSPGRNVSAN